MSMQQKRVELLVFGYINKSCYLLIPIPLIQVTRSYYDKYYYLGLKGEQLNKLLYTKNNEEWRFNKFIIKGIEFQFVTTSNADNISQEVGISDIPKDIEYVDFYAELKCETLNYCIDKMLQRITNKDFNKQNNIIIDYIKVSELKNIDRIDFNCFVDIKYIKYKKQYKKKDYIAPINKLHKMVKFAWDIDAATMQKIKKKEAVFSDNFDNNNWSLKLRPNRYINNNNMAGSTAIYLQCASLALDTNKIGVNTTFVIDGKCYSSKLYRFRFESYSDGFWCYAHGRHHIMSYNKFKEKKTMLIQVMMEIVYVHNENDDVIEWKQWKLAYDTKDDKLMRQKTPLNTFPIHYEPSYDRYVYPTMFSSKEIDELYDIVNLFDNKIKKRGKRNISWRMVKNMLNGKGNTNNRCRTRWELFQVYQQILKQNMNNNDDDNNKNDKNYDPRFVDLREEKDEKNKKLFIEPLDFDDITLNKMTGKLTKKFHGKLDIDRSRVIELIDKIQNKQQHLSHKEAIQSAYNKLNLSVQQKESKCYSPGYIWKNQWENSDK